MGKYLISQNMIRLQTLYNIQLKISNDLLKNKIAKNKIT